MGGNMRIFRNYFVVLSLFIIVICSFFLMSCNDEPEEHVEVSLVYEEQTPTSFASFKKVFPDGTIADSDFKVITFTDLHLADDSSAETIITLTILEKHIVREKPDLVVITGDICLGPNAAEAQVALNSVFERNNQYYATILGNHDGEGTGLTREENILNYEDFTYCVTTIGPDNIYGYGNYMINILGPNNVIKNTLVFMDSGDYATSEKCLQYGLEFEEGYDCIKPDQIEWYENSLNSIKMQNNGIMPISALFIHIPLFEYSEAYNQAFNLNDTTDTTLLYGIRLEPECSSKINSLMFASILNVNSTKLVICGHDHVNDYSVMYQGVKLTYSQSMSYGSYFVRATGNILSYFAMLDEPTAEFTDGATILTFGSTDIIPTQILNQDHPEVFAELDELILETDINPITLP